MLLKVALNSLVSLLKNNELCWKHQKTMWFVFKKVIDIYNHYENLENVGSINLLMERIWKEHVTIGKCTKDVKHKEKKIN